MKWATLGAGSSGQPKAFWLLLAATSLWQAIEADPWGHGLSGGCLVPTCLAALRLPLQALNHQSSWGKWPKERPQSSHPGSPDAYLPAETWRLLHRGLLAVGAALVSSYMCQAAPQFSRDKQHSSGKSASFPKAKLKRATLLLGA